MARHVCHNCGATVAGDEQFCPTCGSFLGEEEEPATDDYEQFELGAAPPPPAQSAAVRPGAAIVCPSCGTPNTPGNRHCEECGARLSQGPLPAAPRPAVQATAGVRAVVAIAGLLLGVILIALLFRVFDGDDPGTITVPADDDATTTTATPVEPTVLDPLDVSCTVEGLGSFICENLISGTDNEFQVNWNDLVEDDQTLSITIRFRLAVAITEIQWSNIEGDETRFRRNFRARSLSISADDSVTPVQFELQNTPGTQRLPFAAVNTNQVTITVESAWPAELFEENIFSELAIDEIEVVGRPARPTAPSPNATTGTTGISVPDETTSTTTP